MVQSVATVSGSLSASSGGTADLTSSGFGTVAAAIIHVSTASTTNNPEGTDAAVAIGFWDGTNCQSMTYHTESGQGTTDTYSDSDASSLVIRWQDGVSDTWAVSNITDGIRLTNNDNVGGAYYITATLISGVDVAIGAVEPSNTQNNTTTVSGLSFAPSVVLMTGHSLQTLSSRGSDFNLSYGVAVDDGSLTQHCMGMRDTSGVGTSQKYTYFANNRIGLCIGNGSLTFSVELTSWETDGFVVTTRDGNNFSADFSYMALGGDVLAELVKISTPTSTGDDSVSTTNTPKALVVAQLGIPAENTLYNAGNRTDGFSIGMSDGSNDYAFSLTSGDNIGTTNTQVYYNSSGVIDVDFENAGFGAFLDATASFGAASIDFNYTKVLSTSRYGWGLAFTEVATGSVNRLVNGVLIRC